MYLVLPEVTEGNNKDHENASSLLELKESIDMGRYFVAKKHISTGDTLVVEAPRAACLLPKNFGSHCHHCFQRSENENNKQIFICIEPMLFILD